MSTAATQQQPPVVPPRPNRGQDHGDQHSFPKVPPRPTKRGPSPNPDRYAPSPLNGGIPSKKDRSDSNDGHIDRSKSVEIPHAAGEEGMEYEALSDQASSPEQTRTIDEGMKIHAPKATMPAQSAKQRIMQVTRTDSDRAASFGIGKPSSDVPTPSNRSLKKKASTTSALSHSEVEDEERGIPEIGQHVPLLANAGDVQAPSPAPGALSANDASRPTHKRKNSSRGLPPGSYGLHGHGVASQDKLDKEYYKKHPETLRSEHHIYQHDRATDFSMSSEQLNKMVRDTENHGHGVGTSEHHGIPSEQAAWAAYNEVASRPHSTKPPIGSPGSDHVIVVEEPNKRRSVLFSDEAIPAPPDDNPEDDYRAPILAEDEVRKSAQRVDQVPAVEVSRERRGSDYEMEPPRSRPTSRPASLYKMDSSEMRSTPLEDVIEYEPLFPEDDEHDSKKNLTAAQIKEMKQRFPSRDIWEDAPNSAHYTAEVSTPELPEEGISKVPSRTETETPAHAFARRQEELAEKEGTHPDAFLWRNTKAAAQPPAPTWSSKPLSAAQESVRSNSSQQRFPSRDVWEDTPDSLQLETTVSGPQMEQNSPIERSQPQVPERPQRKSTDPKEKPVIPDRPKPKSPEETTGKPVIPDRPKPQVPARPSKAGDAPAPKAKPAVPARPVGGKIAALQAGFMADLNKKLGLGPQAPKSEEEEAKPEQAAEQPQEKAPLSDARKGRARGPQRRAPAPAAAPVTRAAADHKPKLSFSTAVTVWSIDPELDGGAQVDGAIEENDVKDAPQPVESAVEAEEKEAKDDAEATNVEAEPELESEPATLPKSDEAAVEEPTTEDAPEKQDDEDHPTEIKTKTLATNVAGDSLVEATLEEDKVDSKVEPKEVDADVVKN